MEKTDLAIVMKMSFYAGLAVGNHNYACDEKGDSKYCIDEEDAFTAYKNGDLNIDDTGWVSIDEPIDEPIQTTS